MTTLGVPVLINLPGDVERLENMKRRFQAQRLEFVLVPGVAAPPSKPESRLEPGHWGCALSHRAALEQARAEAWDRVLIFEDDCVMRDDFAAELAQVAEEVAEEQWDVLHLGARCDRLGHRISHRVWALEVGWHTHCYSVHKRAYDRVIAWIDRTVQAQNWTFDCFRIPGLVRWVAQPLLAIQEPGLSRTTLRRELRLPEYFPKESARKLFASRCAEMRRWT